MAEAEAPEPAEADPWTGRVLDRRYRVGRVLGEGGMGSAFLAVDERMEREVVVKRPHLGMLSERGFRERFAKEVKALTRLEHPNILKVLDSGESDEGVPFAVLPFLSGGSLRDRLPPGSRPSVADLRTWLPQMAAALDYVHSEGFVHRDVKPGNVLFDANGHPYLADFGLARATAPEATRLTTTGGIAGSPEYMAPEAIVGKDVGPAYDQYALGVVVYEALAGTLPHVGATALELFLKKKTEPPRPLSDSRPDLPGPATAAVMRTLESEPAKRHASCTGFVLALDSGAPAIPGASSAAAVPVARTKTLLGALPAAPSPLRIRRRWLVPALAGGAIALAAAGWFAFGRGGGSDPPAGTPPAPVTAAGPLAIEVPVEGQVALPGELVVVRGKAPGLASGDVLRVDGKIVTPNPAFFETTVRLANEETRTIEITVGPKDGLARTSERRTVRIEKPQSGEVPEWAHVSMFQVTEARRLRVPVAFENDVGMRFVLIPAGRFLMGSHEAEEGRRGNETQHAVTLTRPFFAQATEATNRQVRAWRPERRSPPMGGVEADEDDQPAIRVTFREAEEYAVWLGTRGDGRAYRLPTESEWEYAARAGTHGTCWWGDDVGDVARHDNFADAAAKRAWPNWETGESDDGFAATAPVASFDANAWGLHDVLGNAAEWVSGWYSAYPAGDVVDPPGAATGRWRTARSPGWASAPKADAARSARRVYLTEAGADPDDGHDTSFSMGFRLVADLPPPLAVEVPKEGQSALRGELVVVRGFCRDLAEGEVVTVDGKVVPQGPEFFEATVRLGKEDAKSIEIAVGPKDGPARLKEKRTLKIETPKDGEVPEWAHVSLGQVEEARRLKVPVAFENSIGMRFVLISAGEYDQGDAFTRRVRLSRSFYVQATHATNSEMRRWKPDRRSRAVTGFELDGDTQPAVHVTHPEALAWAAWMSAGDPARRYRLPTEAESEFFSRAGARGPYWWGSDAAEAAKHANFADRNTAKVRKDWKTADLDDGFAASAPVASFDANAFGLWDVQGNAGWWTSDRYADWERTSEVDPAGAPDGPAFCARGTAWNTPGALRLGVRCWLLPDGTPPEIGGVNQALGTGVRLVVDAPPPR